MHGDDDAAPQESDAGLELPEHFDMSRPVDWDVVPVPQTNRAQRRLRARQQRRDVGRGAGPTPG